VNRVNRYTPSLTVRLDRGHAFSALAAWRAAPETGGRFLLRTGDIELIRRRPEFETAILEHLS
jgi:glutamyl-Q tRNA(Asp) synthetase